MIEKTVCEIILIVHTFLNEILLLFQIDNNPNID